MEEGGWGHEIVKTISMSCMKVPTIWYKKQALTTAREKGRRPAWCHLIWRHLRKVGRDFSEAALVMFLSLHAICILRELLESCCIVN